MKKNRKVDESKFDFIEEYAKAVEEAEAGAETDEAPAEEAEKTMTSNEDMMNTIYDYTCEAYSNSGLEGYVETYYYNATNTANRTYVLSDGDFYMYIMVSYQFSDPFDLEFSVETM